MPAPEEVKKHSFLAHAHCLKNGYRLDGMSAQHGVGNIQGSSLEMPPDKLAIVVCYHHAWMHMHITFQCVRTASKGELDNSD